MRENLPVKIVKSVKAPKEPGKYYRLLCMTGKNKGLSYYLGNKRVVMGRSEKVDVQVLDTKSSREHAELALVGGQYVLTDLGSQNGVIVNDLKVSQHRLKENDKIIIGQTVYKYNEIDVKSADLLTNVDIDEEEDEEENEDSKSKSIKEKKKPNLIIILLVIVAVAFLIPSEDGKKSQRRGKRVGNINAERITIDSPREVEIDKDIRDKLKAFLHRGQREYREGNYFRAIEQFELALILVPNHGDASFYLKKTKQAAKDYLFKLKEKAAQDKDALKLTSALNQYCAIVSFLQDDPTNERYIEAEKQIEILEEQLGYDKGEVKCY